MSGDNLSAMMGQIIGETVRFTITSERLRGMLVDVRDLLRDMRELVETDPDLIPELKTAVDHLGEVGDAIERAHVFADARARAQVERL